ncbi:MAG TPA: response regulator transcription factor [Bacteroidales bacterium]
MMKKLLFVEDDKSLSSVVVESLEDLGFEVCHAMTGEEALEVFQKEMVDLVLMDVELPGKLDGFDTAEMIRKSNPDLPILFATARQEGEDLKRGFQIGCMDYVRKPYKIREIAFRIEGLIGSENKKETLISVGKYTFDPILRRLCINSGEFRLSNQESSLLALLCENENKIVDKDFLVQSLWGGNDDSKSKENSLHNLIYNLRKYLKEDPALMLEVVVKQGYRISIIPSAEATS